MGGAIWLVNHQVYSTILIYVHKDSLSSAIFNESLNVVLTVWLVFKLSSSITWEAQAKIGSTLWVCWLLLCVLRLSDYSRCLVKEHCGQIVKRAWQTLSYGRDHEVRVAVSIDISNMNAAWDAWSYLNQVTDWVLSDIQWLSQDVLYDYH